MNRYTISKIARACSLSRSTLLYYDRISLLRPSGRTASGYRYYTEVGVAEKPKLTSCQVMSNGAGRAIVSSD